MSSRILVNIRYDEKLKAKRELDGEGAKTEEKYDKKGK